MKCDGDADRLHRDQFIAAKSSTSASYRNLGAFTEKTTSTSYTDLELVSAALCDKCLCSEARREVRVGFLIVGIIFFFLSLVGLGAMTSPEAGTGLSVFLGVFLFITWAFFLTAWFLNWNRWRKGIVIPSDYDGLARFASKKAKASGRDVCFTMQEWKEAQKKSEAAEREKINRILKEHGL